ncbi:MAG: sulfur carrier protein ThiS [Candidatus Dormibacteraceae bacterium]
MNGRAVELPSPTTLADYLQSLGAEPRAVAVELNGEILQRAAYAGCVLREGDIVEIVRMVGGGAPLASRELAAKLRLAIRRGDLRAGDPLRQADLIAGYAVTRGVAQGALTMLRREGLVAPDDHRRLVCRRPDRQDVRESYELRITLECLAIELATSRLTGRDLQRLRALATALRAEPRDRDQELDQTLPAFHGLLNRAAGRPLLLRMINDLLDASRGYRALLAYCAGGEACAGLIADYEGICEALGERDQAQAGRLLRDHLERAERRLVEALGPAA